MAITSADAVVVHTYGSPGLGSVNTHWVESATGVVVIDGQRLLSDARTVLAEIALTRKPVEAVVITHHHPDHIGGTAAFASAYPAARVLAGPATIESIRNDEGGLMTLARQWLGADFQVADRLEPLPKNQVVTLAGMPFTVRQAGPGEASSMLVLYLEEAGALFPADIVCNAMTPFLAEQRTGLWLEQLDWIRHAFPGTRTAYPGHGLPAPIDSLVASTRAYLITVRDLVRDRLRRSRELTPELRSEIVAAIDATYAGYVPVAAIPDAVGMNVDGVWAELQRSLDDARRPAPMRVGAGPSDQVRRDTPGWRFYQKHLAFFYAKDVEGLLASDYASDAQLVSYDFAVRGHDAMRPIFAAYLDMLGDFTVRTTERFTETADSILLEATLAGPKFGERKVYDVFVLRDGKAIYHFTGTR